jgi:hypothetical protein
VVAMARIRAVFAGVRFLAQLVVDFLRGRLP